MILVETYVRWFDAVGLGDVGLVGGKNASLGELYRELRPLGVPVPEGFALTADAYRHLLGDRALGARVRAALEGVETMGEAELARRAAEARAAIVEAGLPDDIWAQIARAYRRLSGPDGEVEVAVRSSATAEDLPEASFAGQQESFLNVRGEGALRLACARCLASAFTERAIAYRRDRGFDHAKVAVSVGVQRMVRSDLGASGVMFTLDTESGFRDVVLVNAAYGLGENVVQGAVDPDEFYVFKPTLRAGKRAVVRRRLGAKQQRMVYAEGELGATTRNVPVAEAERGRYCLTDDEVERLARFALAIEAHYSKKHGRDTPMDVEWAKDGQTGGLWVVQARPETVRSRAGQNELVTYTLGARSEVAVTGKSVGQGIGAGPVRALAGPSEMGAFHPGEVLVAESTSPDWEPVMRASAAIVTERGGRTCHAAIVSRELGIPAVVGAEGAREALRDGEEVTVSCAQGDTGYVYRGRLPFRVDRTRAGDLPRPRTAIQLNLADPSKAFALAALPNDGVGLARIEFIINHVIRAHPMALLHPERVHDPAERAAIEAMTAGYEDRGEYFVERLATGVATIAAAFYPKPVVVRLSDFKSNEYAKLVGGAAFEPAEENPMIGLRGAARYAHPSYAEAFALECRALGRVRGAMGLTNVKLMIPFCRRIAEGERVLAAMAAHGLRRGESGLEVYVMCEIPNNVALIDDFCRLFDGISIGSNDLTQLTLGVDRDSAQLADSFDERDPGVLAMIRLAVEGAHRNRRHAGICGQAPSDYPEFAEFLVRLGIDAISLNPDAVLSTTLRVLELERGAAGRRA